MTFKDLDRLRRYLEEINERQVLSLQLYHGAYAQSFFHRLDVRPRNRISEASTATCVMSLLATDKWDEGPWKDTAEELATGLLEAEWRSAELQANNIFSTAHVLEALTHLLKLAPQVAIKPKYKRRVARAEEILLRPLRSNGSVQVMDYPPSAYLTHLTVRVLILRKKLNERTSKKVAAWARAEINYQIALILADSKTKDYYQLAYSIILAASLQIERPTPDELRIQQTAVNYLFDGQREDGSWPLSRPLFHYPRVGNAHCYEYEMLVQLLQEQRLEDALLGHLPKLAKAASVLLQTSFDLGGNGRGWSSGHHPQFRGPESWSTASVFHFAHALHRLIAEAMRRSIFEFLDQPYSQPRPPKNSRHNFAPDLLDSELKTNGSSELLLTVLYDKFVGPLAAQVSNVKLGRSLPSSTPMSLILFGPPGTSKTELTKYISDYLGWPRLVVDPSYFVRGGLDRVQAEADLIFEMLASAEQLVVLLDEFDEMVRDRQQAREVLTRFLTTSMLPKLALINKRRRIVFIVATNYINKFDLAISRRGRFDRIIQVMPPTFRAKMKKWPQVREKLNELQVSSKRNPIRSKINDLTYDEYKYFAREIASIKSSRRIIDLLRNAHDKCTLNSGAEGKPNRTWKEVCKEQESKIRLG